MSRTHEGVDSLADQLKNELIYLRSVVREAGDSFILRTEGRIEGICRMLEERGWEVDPGMVAGWLRRVHRHPIDPTRGKLKDIKRLDMLVDLLEEMTEEIPPASGKVRARAVKGKKEGGSRSGR